MGPVSAIEHSSSARHPLPVSGYWGSDGTGPVLVWCGRCRAYFRADQEWLDRFVATKLHRAESQRLRDAGTRYGRDTPYTAEEIRDYYAVPERVDW